MKPPAVKNSRWWSGAFAILILAASATRAQAFAYLFSETQGAATVTHPKGYTGAGGAITLTIGINPASMHASEMIVPTQNAIFVWNQLQPTLGNLGTLGISNGFDFESALLHEIGHALGLEHPNLGAEAFGDGRSEYTRTTKGTNGVYDLGAGSDGVIGSRDDSRGDDVNLNWFRTSNNDPFTLASVVDSSTYSRSLSLLPVGQLFSANASRAVAAVTPGASGTEAVMQQGSFTNETQRMLGHDDVAGIRFAMAGLDGLAGTTDDYTLALNFAGVSTTADVLVGFDDSKTSFAVTNYSAMRLGATEHLTLDTAQIYFNSTANWVFNQTSVPEPGSVSLLGVGALWSLLRRGVRRVNEPI